MEESSKGTSFENKCEILADLWMQYRYDTQFEDFIQYNDIGLPLAFLISEELVKPRSTARAMVDETFELLLTALKIEDSGFDSLDELLVG